MRRIRIYYPGDLSTGLTVMLESHASHHLLKVLRKKVGDAFWIFNGKGGEFAATLIATQKKIACVEIGKFFERHTESFLSIHVAQGISRGERMDYAIQKASELGVTEITPIFTEFCQVQLDDHRIDKRVAHWQSVANSAAEQSGRCVVPIVHAPIQFSAWIAQNHAVKLICCPRHNDAVFSNTTSIAKNISVAIGSEGGFSDHEIQAALQEKFLTFFLGPRILRTETATVVALTLLQEKFGDLLTIQKIA